MSEAHPPTPEEPQSTPDHAVNPHETPTRQLAAADTFTYHDRDFVRPDATVKDVFAQVLEEQKQADIAAGVEGAREKDYVPSMLGFEWIESDGLRYRVSSYEKLTRVRQSREKSWLHLTAEKHPVRGPEIRRKRNPKRETVPEEVDYRTVDVLDEDGNLVDIVTFSGYDRKWQPTNKIGGILIERLTGVHQGEYDVIDPFTSHFKVGANVNPASPGAQKKVPREILGFRWAGEDELAGPEIAARGRVAVPEISDWDTEARNKPEKPGDMRPKKPEAKAQELFEKLAGQQEELGLHSWVGLTWNTPYPAIDKKTREWERQNVNQMQIVRDAVIIRDSNNPGRSYAERVFEVRTTSPNGTAVNRHMYTLKDLMKQFTNREIRDREIHQKRTLTHDMPGIDAHALEAVWEKLDEADERGPEWGMRWELPEPSGEPGQEYSGGQVSQVELARLRMLFTTDMASLGVKPPDASEHPNHTDWFEIMLQASGDDHVLQDTPDGNNERLTIMDSELGYIVRDLFFELKQLPEEKDRREALEKMEGAAKGRTEDEIAVLKPSNLVRIDNLLFKKQIEKTIGLKKTAQKVTLESGVTYDGIDCAEIGRLMRLSLGQV
jgi:hypothetical protein